MVSAAGKAADRLVKSVIDAAGNVCIMRPLAAWVARNLQQGSTAKGSFCSSLKTGQPIGVGSCSGSICASGEMKDREGLALMEEKLLIWRDLD
jgi:hypothetical protein